MDNMDKILQKRVRGMAVRILATIEHTLSCHMENVRENDSFNVSGADLKVLRNEILNAAGDTTRSLQSMAKTGAPQKVSFDRAIFSCLGGARLEWAEDDDGTEPVFYATGHLGELNQLRDLVGGTGLVYKNTYVCIGLDQVVEHLIPFLDKASATGIKVAGGHYKPWRDEVCDLFLGGLGDE
jgi:hypothetical protein